MAHRPARRGPQVPEADGLSGPHRLREPRARVRRQARVFRSLFENHRDEEERIERALEAIGLQDSRNRRAGLLAHGHKQWLEIGMLLVQEPKVLLIDEPRWPA